ncbi:DsbA family protein [Patescibacteria group bacterium]|nr:DsbA family protein [Patescibacteria group bacterium]
MTIENIKWYQKIWGRILLGILTIIIAYLLAFSLYVFKLIGSIKNRANITQTSIPSATSLDMTKIRATAENKLSYSIGAANPKITIVEFSDFECPYCKETQPIIQSIVKKYPNDVKLIFRDLPLHDDSKQLAILARCAGEQQKFWPMHDFIFENQGNVNEENLSTMAKSININVSNFSSCLNSEKHTKLIEKDVNDAILLNISGTPAWIINGYKIEGSLPASTWEQIINRILNEK